MTRDEWLRSEDPAAMLRHLTHDARPSGNATVTYPRPTPLASNRKLRLFACACVRQVWHLLADAAECGRCDRGVINVMGHPCPHCKGTGRVNRSRRAVEVAERFADDEVDAEAMKMVRQAALAIQHGEERWRTMPDENRHAAKMAVDCCSEFAASAARQIAEGYKRTMTPSRPAQADLLRGIVGDPFEPVTLPGDWYCKVHNLRLDGARCDGCKGMPSLGESVLRCPWLTPQVLTLVQAAYEDRADDGSLDPLTLLALADALEEAGCTAEALLAALRSPGPHFHSFWPVDLLLAKE